MYRETPNGKCITGDYGSLLLQKEHSFQITEQHIREGLKEAHWPGRFEMVSQIPIVILDGAHNEEGISRFNGRVIEALS